jgi:hypothetical protein
MGGVINGDKHSTNATKKDKLSCSYAFYPVFFLFDS